MDYRSIKEFKDRYKGKDIYKAERFLCAHTMMVAFEGIPAIIDVEQQNIFSLLNGCFCGY